MTQGGRKAGAFVRVRLTEGGARTHILRPWVPYACVAALGTVFVRARELAIHQPPLELRSISI
jgi:hypothetical protein